MHSLGGFFKDFVAKSLKRKTKRFFFFAKYQRALKKRYNGLVNAFIYAYLLVILQVCISFM